MKKILAIFSVLLLVAPVLAAGWLMTRKMAKWSANDGELTVMGYEGTEWARVTTTGSMTDVSKYSVVLDDEGNQIFILDSERLVGSLKLYFLGQSNDGFKLKGLLNVRDFLDCSEFSAEMLNCEGMGLLKVGGNSENVHVVLVLNETEGLSNVTAHAGEDEALSLVNSDVMKYVFRET